MNVLLAERSARLCSRYPDETNHGFRLKAMRALVI